MYIKTAYANMSEQASEPQGKDSLELLCGEKEKKLQHPHVSETLSGN